MSDDYDPLAGEFLRFDKNDPPEVLIVKLGSALNTLGQGIRRTERETHAINRRLESGYITKAHFDAIIGPMQKKLDSHDKIFFWAATTILGAVLIGIVTFFMRGGGTP